MSPCNPKSPAFPIPLSDKAFEECRNLSLEQAAAFNGMSLRTYAAIQAMNGYLSNPHTSGALDDIASWSVESADALLAELAKEKP